MYQRLSSSQKALAHQVRYEHFSVSFESSSPTHSMYVADSFLKSTTISKIFPFKHDKFYPQRRAEVGSETP